MGIMMTMMQRIKKTNMMTMLMQKTVGGDYVDADDADENDDNDYDEKSREGVPGRQHPYSGTMVGGEGTLH